MPVRTIWSDRLEALQQRFGQGRGSWFFVVAALAVLGTLWAVVGSLPHLLSNPISTIAILAAGAVGILVLKLRR